MKISMGAFPLPPTEAYYCPHCGRPLQEPLEICPTCGAPLTQPHRTPLWLRIFLSIVLALFIWPLNMFGALAVAFSQDSVGPGSPYPFVPLVILGEAMMAAAPFCCVGIARLMGTPGTPAWLRVITGLFLAVVIILQVVVVLVYLIGAPMIVVFQHKHFGMGIISLGGIVVAVITVICGIEIVRILTGRGKTKNQEKPSTDTPQL